MIGLLMSAAEGPLMMVGMVAAVAAIFGCFMCARCRMRDCGCIKRCLRCWGIDKFDDFEMMVLVHEAMYTAAGAKTSTIIRITAGDHNVQTDPNSKGNFQQPLTLFVEQGSTEVVVELLDDYERALAVVKFNTLNDILPEGTDIHEHVFSMKQVGKGVLNPKVKLTMVLNLEADCEQPLLAGVSPEVDFLVRQQMQKTGGGGKKKMSEMDMIKAGCCGPLDLFEGMGSTKSVYIAASGPPEQKKFCLAIYRDEHEFEKKKKPIKEIDALHVQSVQPDPGRTNVFVVTHLQKESGAGVAEKMVFRRTDRARDVWVEMIQLLITKAHDLHKEKKDKKHGK